MTSKSKKTNKSKRLIFHDYWDIQDKYVTDYGKHTILFMQVGSFYEAYSTDIIGPNLENLSEILNIILTRKSKSNPVVNETNPYMLGFPDRYLDKYMKILIQNGYTVVIYDQKKVKNITGKEDIYRELAGVYSPGTYTEQTSPDSSNLICMYISDLKTDSGRYLPCIAVSSIDLSTGENVVYESYSTDNDTNYALDETLRFLTVNPPKELIIYKDNTSVTDSSIISYLELDDVNYTICEGVNKNFKLVSYTQAVLSKIFPDRGMLNPIEYVDLERYPYSLICYILLLEFARQHKSDIIYNIDKPKIFDDQNNLILGNNASYQLNVIEHNSRNTPNVKYKCLFDVVNQTSTAIGRRYLKKTLNAPYISIDIIQKRLDCVEEFVNNDKWKNVELLLKGIVDIERLSRKLGFYKIQPYELTNMYFSIENVLKLAEYLKKYQMFDTININSDTITNLKEFIKNVQQKFNTDIMERLNSNDTYDAFFREGISSDIDKMQRDIKNIETLFSNIETVLSKYVTDRGKAVLSKGNKMKLCNNSRDGYFFKISDKRAESLIKNISGKKEIKITDSYSIDISTIYVKNNPKNGKKIFFPFLTDKAKELDLLKIKIKDIAVDIYVNILKSYNEKYTKYFRDASNFVGLVDFIKSAAKCATMYNYTKPVIVNNNNSFVCCKELRHPIVERIRDDVEYIPHDLYIGKAEDNDLEGMLIYGLNSSGKSTIMKSVGISIIMAQCGMYVPAKEYKFMPYRSLFTRISGDDNILKGLSSFALEMIELRAILKRADKGTLIIGDEVCRSTDIISANALVSTTIEMLSKTGSTFIFATHLHDIPTMDNIVNLSNVKPFHLNVTYDNDKDRLIFDRKLKEGSGETVYGVKVAKYLINDTEFINKSQNIVNKLTNIPDSIVNKKRSKYNKTLYMDNCGICKKNVNTTEDLFDTHHINFQKDCKDGFVKDKPHIQMNSKANLIVLCKKCHQSLHAGNLTISKYIETSTGKDIDIKINNVTNKKTNRKYTDEHRIAIQKLKGKSMRYIKSELKEKYNISPSNSFIYKVQKSV